MIKCPNCSKENEDRTNCCIKCGSKLKKTRRAILFLVVLGLLITVGSIIGYLIYKETGGAQHAKEENYQHWFAKAKEYEKAKNWQEAIIAYMNTFQYKETEEAKEGYKKASEELEKERKEFIEQFERRLEEGRERRKEIRKKIRDAIDSAEPLLREGDGILFLEKGEYDKAIDSFTEAIKLLVPY